MPASLKFFRRDPNSLGRGRGVYYRRGNTYKGRRYKGGYYSKYSMDRDRKIKATGYTTSKIGIPRKSKILHTSDGRLSR